MKFTIKTSKLNSILSKAGKGVGNTKIMTITEYLKIKLQDSVLEITATDMNNFITVKADEIEGDNGVAIVKADALIKLVAKTTKQDMTISLADSHIEVKGNGTYKIPVIENEEFPSYEFDYDAQKVDIEVSKLKRAFQVNKSAIATEMLMPCLTGYNMGEKVITTDGVKMCINSSEIFTENILVTQTLADLITSLTAEKVTIQRDKNKLLFTTDNIIIFGAELEGIEEYPDVTPILGVPYESKVVVPKQLLTSALDRLSLFVDLFDNNGVTLTFTDNKIILEDLKKNSQEEIEYEESENVESATIAVNLTYLQDLLGAISDTKVKFEFGEELPLKIVEDNVVQILSTMSIEE